MTKMSEEKEDMAYKLNKDEEFGYSQEKIAKLMGVSQPTISRSINKSSNRKENEKKDEIIQELREENQKLEEKNQKKDELIKAAKFAGCTEAVFFEDNANKLKK